MNWNGLELPDNNIYFQDNDSLIYCADCRDILPLIPDKSIDLVLTDPPYGIGIAEWDTIDYYDLLFKESYRLLDDGRYAFIFSTKKNLKRPQFSHDIFAVIKNFAQYRQHLGMFDAWYPIIYFVKNKPRKVINPSRVLIPKRNWFLLNTANTSRNEDNPKSSSNHETPKNTELVKYILNNFSEIKDLILDPFLGSGTTAYCAKKLGRKCIGIEIEEKYCEIAKKRLAQSVMRLEV